MKTFREYLAEAKVNESGDGELRLFIGYGKTDTIMINFPTNMISNYNLQIKFDEDIYDEPKKHKELTNKLDVISKKYDKEFKDFFKKFTLELEKETQNILSKK